MELYFLALLILLMALALASGFPVAFALPGSAVLTILIAAGAGAIFAGDASAYFHQGGPSQWLSAGVTNLRGVYWEVERDTLIAIPLFIFMGIMLQRSKIAEDLLLTMAQLFGPVPGGLGISVVFVGALLAATTGILGATVVAMGLISLPAMLRNGYSKPLATGAIAASGTLGQIIPPSIVLIILADQLASAVDQAGTMRQNLFKEATGQFSMPSEFSVTSTSAGEMFLGALVPGLVLVGLYMLFILIVALIRPRMAPSVPREGEFDLAFLKNVLITLVPPLALIFLVLGSIIAGIATVNQAGAIGATGAMLMASYRLTEGRKRSMWPAIMALIGLAGISFALANYEMNIKNISDANQLTGIRLGVVSVSILLVAVLWATWRTLRIGNTLRDVMIETAKTTSLVFIILLGAAMLTAAFRAFGGEDVVREFLITLPGGFWSQFVIVMAVIFFLGFFLDFIEIAVVVVPIVSPILLADPAANITAVWLGVMIGLNIQTSFLTPPFGFALFYLRGVAPPEVRTVDMYKGVVPFITLQLIALAIVGYNPPLVNYLPTRVSLLSDTAPPPRNPKLQYCLEQFVAARYDANGAEIAAAIDKARSLDLEGLPTKLRTTLSKSFDQAAAARGLLDAAYAAAAAVDAQSDQFRPLHDEVRQIQKDMGRAQERIKRAETELRRLRGPDADKRRERLEQIVATSKAEVDALKALIPERWAGASKAFNELTKAERDARRNYQRASDAGYEPVQQVLAVLRSTPRLAPLDTRISGLVDTIRDQSPDAAADAIEAVRSELNDVEGADDIRSELSKARRALKGRTVNRDAAVEAVNKALALHAEQMAWRNDAGARLLPALENYEASIRDTVGARMQPKLTRQQALSIAQCSAGHRDVSLSF
ncbi:MAG: TRAP transporter large permease subunit [Burkholderiaceae bacterium]